MNSQTRTKFKNLVIIGDSAFAEVACEYFTRDSEYIVVAFAVERIYLKSELLLGLPVVPLDEIAVRFPPTDHYAYVAIVYSQLNRLRSRLLRAAEQIGYAMASYVSSRAFVWPNVTLGKHCFIFENNVVQPFVTIGDNVVLWSGNHIGHHSHIADNVFVSSHVVISGFCNVGSNCFLGVNVAVGNNVSIARDCWIGPGVVITQDTKEAELYRGPAAEPSKVSALRFFRVKD
ncbi:acetyltransferase [Bradyrhizobium sp. S69]|uniref:acetyltransferase n=1 Tax=Bradyrhizobium sp. S69 TaxID=1641856 RepID=UPI00131C1BDB|nr:acetyltransferase [Bradyrhizobium sp. S69]